MIANSASGSIKPTLQNIVSTPWNEAWGTQTDEKKVLVDTKRKKKSPPLQFHIVSHHDGATWQLKKDLHLEQARRQKCNGDMAQYWEFIKF